MRFVYHLTGYCKLENIIHPEYLPYPAVSVHTYIPRAQDQGFNERPQAKRHSSDEKIILKSQEG